MTNRRQFLWGGLAVTGGLAVGFGVPVARQAATRLPHAPPLGDPGWIRIGADDSITIFTSLSELGQGVWTCVAQLVGEELGAEWSRIQIEMAPSWRAYTAPIGFWTASSSSAQRLFGPMREIGACARLMLINAAAREWSVPGAECHAAAGVVHQPASGRQARFGALANAAAKLKVPTAPALKPRKDWTFIGQSMPRVEIASKLDGSAQYGMDFQLPGMLVAAVAQSPAPGGRLRSVNRDAALAQPGVLQVIELDDTVAVVAKTYWQANQGLAKAAVTWTPSTVDTQAIGEELRRLVAVEQPAASPLVTPDSGAGSRTIEAIYDTPLLLHAQLEPLNATAKVDRFSAHLWAPTQAQGDMGAGVAKALGLWGHAVTVRTALVGGGFGRRLSTDDGVTAARIAQRFRGTPVKVIWSREQDSIQARFRPMSAAKLRATLDGQGMIQHLDVHVASLGQGSRSGGIAEGPYAIGSRNVRYSGVDAAIRTGSWRSVDNSQNLFYRESFIDECAHRAGIDPLSYRRRLLAQNARALRALDALQTLTAKTSADPKRPLGYAIGDGLGSICSQAVEVIAAADGAWKIARVFAVIDCGTAINPGQIRAQIEGGILFGLSAALSEQATYVGGMLQQTNYDRYRVLRMQDTPEIRIEILESPDVPIGGIGEAGVPLIAPALANAVFAATGSRLRSLPLRPTPSANT